MRLCPGCGRDSEDDSCFCGFCGRKFPSPPENEEASEKIEAPAGWRCENCGEQSEEIFDACWKCGTKRTRTAEAAPAGGEAAVVEPLISVDCAGRRIEVYEETVRIIPAALPEGKTEPAFSLLIKNIAAMNFSEASETDMGRMTINYAGRPKDDEMNLVNTTEYLSFGVAANFSMQKVFELIKNCSKALDDGAKTTKKQT